MRMNNGGILHVKGTIASALYRIKFNAMHWDLVIVSLIFSTDLGLEAL